MASSNVAFRSVLYKMLNSHSDIPSLRFCSTATCSLEIILPNYILVFYVYDILVHDEKSQKYTNREF